MSELANENWKEMQSQRPRAVMPQARAQAAA
jgi:hypothetical protein